jgi:hypothetical protein
MGGEDDDRSSDRGAGAQAHHAERDGYNVAIMLRVMSLRGPATIASYDADFPTRSLIPGALDRWRR